MPPTRHRVIDDSRSEASSVVTAQKERSLLGPASGSGILKGKKPALGTNGIHKASVQNAGVAAISISTVTAGPAEPDKDPSLPRVSDLPLI
jgi:hypothetical protein